MTIEFQNKIKDELRQAYTYFGETDTEYLEEKVDQTLDELRCMQNGVTPSTIQTDKGPKTGHLIDIALSFDESRNKMRAVMMLVSENTIEYVLNSYIVHKDEDWNPGDPIKFDNEKYITIELKDLTPESFA